MRGRFYSKVVGVTALNLDGTSRQTYISKYCRPGVPLVFERERSNPYDKNAVAVYVGSHTQLFGATVQIGYLSSELAQQIAPLMHKGELISGVVTQVTGGAGDKATFGVNILITEA